MTTCIDRLVELQNSGKRMTGMPTNIGIPVCFFEVLVPTGLPVRGAVLADQVKSVDWIARRADMIGRLPVAFVNKVLAKVKALLDVQNTDWKKPVTTRNAIISRVGVPGV